jgi:hypothetical protein
VLLAVALKLYGEVKDGFFKQLAFGSDLIGGDCLMLGTERRIQDAHIVTDGSRARLRVSGEDLAPGE